MRRPLLATAALAAASAVAWIFVAGLAYYGCGEEDTLRDGSTFERFCHDESAIGQHTVLTAFTVALVLLTLAPLARGRRRPSGGALLAIVIAWVLVVAATAALPQVLDS